jgi:hypothetical protein
MRGGKREGAGRPKGSTTTKTAIDRAVIDERVASIRDAGVTPLEVLLEIMRSSKDQATVIDCAKAAAPYLHRRLAAIEHTGDPENPIEQHSRVEMVIVDAQHDTSFGAEEAGAFAQTRPI